MLKASSTNIQAPKIKTNRLVITMGDINKRTLSCKYESLDYDLIENVIYLEHQHKSKLRNFITRDLQRWIAIFLIGFVAALSGFFAGFAVRFFTTVKFSQVIKLADDQCSQYNVNATFSVSG